MIENKLVLHEKEYDDSDAAQELETQPDDDI